MIETIAFKNFKAFKNLENLNIKPITILCGTNSCGKSSILQSILLLKQTIESQNPNQTLLLNGRFVHLGSFNNIIYEKKIKSDIVLNFSFKIKKEDFAFRKKRTLPFHFILRELLNEKNYALKQAEYRINYIITFNTSPKAKKKSFITDIHIKNITYSIEAITATGEIIPDSDIEITYSENDLYEISWNNINNRFSINPKTKNSGKENNIKIDFVNLIPMSFSNKEDNEKVKNLPELGFIFYRLNDLLQAIYSSYNYIGPLREEPSRRYIYEDEVIEIGVKGENAAYIFTAEQDQVLKNHYFFDNSKKNFYEKKDPITLSEAVNSWLSLMNIQNLKTETNNEIININLNSNTAKKTRVNIADVGFGVSQIFPIILEGLRMQSGSSLLLEQPEIHLHPNLQMQMADYFISLALSNKKLIIETHSDHIINRLVRRIVEDNSYNLKNLVGIYFIKATETGSTFEEIIIDDKKGIINWPNEFFDQTASEQEKIIQAGISKRMKNQ